MDHACEQVVELLDFLRGKAGDHQLFGGVQLVQNLLIDLHGAVGDGDAFAAPVLCRGLHADEALGLHPLQQTRYGGVTEIKVLFNVPGIDCLALLRVVAQVAQHKGLGAGQIERCDFVGYSLFEQLADDLDLQPQGITADRFYGKPPPFLRSMLPIFGSMLHNTGN